MKATIEGLRFTVGVSPGLQGLGDYRAIVQGRYRENAKRNGSYDLGIGV